MFELAGKDERPARYGPKTVLWTSASMADSGLHARRRRLEFRALDFDGSGFPLDIQLSSTVSFNGGKRIAKKKRKKKKKVEHESRVFG